MVFTIKYGNELRDIPKQEATSSLRKFEERMPMLWVQPFASFEVGSLLSATRQVHVGQLSKNMRGL